MSLTWLLFFWFSGVLLWAGIAGFAIWVIARHIIYEFGREDDDLSAAMDACYLGSEFKKR